MSPQLTLSSLFSVLALAALCITTSAGDLAGIGAKLTVPTMVQVQAEPLPGLLP
jgi:uncharacterized membrane protein YadS